MAQTSATDSDVLVPLRDGFAARTSVVVWLIDASFRLRFRVDQSELVVSPRAAVTPDDDRFIRQHRNELLATVAYVERMADAPM